MTWRTVGLGLTLAAVALAVFVQLIGRDDWWGGPAIFAVVVALYWSVGTVLFDSRES